MTVAVQKITHQNDGRKVCDRVTGTHFHSISGPGGSGAHVVLMPGGPELHKHALLFILAHDLVNCVVRADWPRLRPTAYPNETLLWAVRNADVIHVWSGLSADEARAAQAVDNGANFVLTIETTRVDASEWTAFVRRHKRADAGLAFPDDMYAYALGLD